MLTNFGTLSKIKRKFGSNSQRNVMIFILQKIFSLGKYAAKTERNDPPLLTFGDWMHATSTVNNLGWLLTFSIHCVCVHCTSRSGPFALPLSCAHRIIRPNDILWRSLCSIYVTTSRHTWQPKICQILIHSCLCSRLHVPNGIESQRSERVNAANGEC